jgi:hypothetical protein
MLEDHNKLYHLCKFSDVEYLTGGEYALQVAVEPHEQKLQKILMVATRQRWR